MLVSSSAVTRSRGPSGRIPKQTFLFRKGHTGVRAHAETKIPEASQPLRASITSTRRVERL